MALPPVAEHIFGVVSVFYTVSFVSAFGAVKAVMNLVAGRHFLRHGLSVASIGLLRLAFI